MSRSRVIMVVDDEEVVRDVLCTYFEAKGHVTVSIGNGQSAISYAKTIKPDLIFLDIKMPGLDGIETCQRLKQVLQYSSGTGIIIITGYGTADNLKKSLDSGAIDVIRKPFDLEDVHKRLDSWCSVKHSMSEPARIRAYTKKVNKQYVGKQDRRKKGG